MRTISIIGREGLYGTCDYSPIDETESPAAAVRALAEDVIKFIKNNPDRDIEITCIYEAYKPTERY